MDKKPPPLLGFNNNVRHRGRVFHIQTEDSGIKHARIVTHLFADGGRIVNSTRTDYAEHLGRPDMHEVLRRIMREQHKAMFIRLRAGELDSLIESACGPQPTEASARERQAAGPGVVAPKEASPLPAPVAAAPDSPPPRPAAQQPPAPPPPPKRRRLSNPNLQPAPPSIAPPPGELELDEAILEGSGRRPARRRSSPETASVAAPEPQPERELPAAPSAAEPEPEPRAKVPAERATEEEARYAPPRPPNIFEAPLTEHSIFGERLIREKSLDEVILSYLAEDLEGGTNE